MTVDHTQVLVRLGFGLASSSPAAAVREFQGYASLDRAAKETAGAGVHSDRLASCPLPPELRFKGTPNGLLEDSWPEAGGTRTTVELIELWDQNNLRCPLVVEAWSMAGDKAECGKELARRECVADNVWAWDQVPAPARRFFVRDFSGVFYPLGSDAPVRWPLGKFVEKVVKPEKPGGKATVYRGPYTKAPWQARVELSPGAVGLTGLPGPGTPPGSPPTADDRALSTYRIVRAVYDRECCGYVDVFNAYDRAGLSAGGFHYTLRFGELAAYLAFLLERTAARERFCRPWGLLPRGAWNADGGGFFQAGNRTYAGTWLWPDPVPTADIELDLFRSWHWLARFQALSRSADLPGDDYAYARLRLRNVLETEIPSNPKIPRRGGGKPTRLGDVVRSELGAAYLLRWHVNRPADVVSHGLAGAPVVKALAAANLGGKAADALTAADVAKLTNRLAELAPRAIRTDFAAMRAARSNAFCWQLLRTWGGTPEAIAAANAHLRLGEGHSPGWLLDETNLPARPYPVTP
jgi:hypothetical protein